MASPSTPPPVRDFDPRDPPRYGEWVRVQGVTYSAVEVDDSPTQPNGAPLNSGEEYSAPPTIEPREERHSKLESTPFVPPVVEVRKEVFDVLGSTPSAPPVIDPQQEERDVQGSTLSAPPALEQVDSVGPGSTGNSRLDEIHNRIRTQRFVAGVLLFGLVLIALFVYRNRNSDSGQRPGSPSKTAVIAVLHKRNFSTVFADTEWKEQRILTDQLPQGVEKTEAWWLSISKTEKFTVSYFAYKKQPKGSSAEIKKYLLGNLIDGNHPDLSLKKVVDGSDNSLMILEAEAKTKTPGMKYRLRFVIREKPQFEVWKLVATGSSSDLNKKFFKSFKPSKPQDKSTPEAKS